MTKKLKIHHQLEALTILLTCAVQGYCWWSLKQLDVTSSQTPSHIFFYIITYIHTHPAREGAWLAAAAPLSSMQGKKIRLINQLNITQIWLITVLETEVQKELIKMIRWIINKWTRKWAQLRQVSSTPTIHCAAAAQTSCSQTLKATPPAAPVWYQAALHTRLWVALEVWH